MSFLRLLKTCYDFPNEIEKLATLLASVIKSSFFAWVHQEFLIGGGGGQTQITCNDVIRNFGKEGLLWDKDTAEWKIKR